MLDAQPEQNLRKVENFAKKNRFPMHKNLKSAGKLQLLRE